jgi:hypothetical protein
MSFRINTERNQPVVKETRNAGHDALKKIGKCEFCILTNNTRTMRCQEKRWECTGKIPEILREHFQTEDRDRSEVSSLRRGATQECFEPI